MSHVTHSSPFIIVHDWTITPDFIVVPINPAQIRVGANIFLRARPCPSCKLVRARHGRGQRLPILIPRGGGEPIELRADSFFNIFHLGPVHAGYAEGELIVHACITDRYSFGREMGFDARAQEFDPIGWSAKGGANPPPRLERFVLHVPSQQVVSCQTMPLAISAGGEAVPVDMPTFHPLRDGERARYCYFAGAPRPEGWFPFCTVVKADLETGAALQWDPGEGCVVSEPMLLPRDDGGMVWRGEAAEDEGWLVSLVHDARAGRSSLAVFDAAAFDEGPIAQLDLGALCAWGVHGHFGGRQPRRARDGWLFRRGSCRSARRNPRRGDAAARARRWFSSASNGTKYMIPPFKTKRKKRAVTALQSATRSIAA